MMWDFSGAQGRRSPRPPPQMPAPSFPVPTHASSHTMGSPYPPLPLFGSTSPPLSAQSQDFGFSSYSDSRAVALPSSTAHYTTSSGQNIVIRHSTHHTSSSHRRQRRHSYTIQAGIPSPAASVPQVPIYPTSTSYSGPNNSMYHSSHHHTTSSSRPRPSGSHNNSYSEQPPPPPKKLTKPSTSGSKQNQDFQYYSKCTGRRKAVCIGINYHGQSNALRGCVNDAKNVRKFLIKNGYRSEDIVLLTDDVNDPRQIPTRKNIIACMKWLVRDAHENDALFIHYSGHGGQTPDLDGDELDGFDEVIFPLDFKKNGHITDDEMHELMVRPLPPRCRLTALFDACHSGTVLDLPYIYSSHGRLKGSHISDKSRKNRSTNADVISWSGCQDGQTSADTFHGGVAVGAMSHAFIDSLTKRPEQSYQDLLRSVRLILHPRYSQKPQLGSSHHINTGLKFVF